MLGLVVGGNDDGLELGNALGLNCCCDGAKLGMADGSDNGLAEGLSDGSIDVGAVNGDGFLEGDWFVGVVVVIGVRVERLEGQDVGI